MFMIGFVGIVYGIPEGTCREGTGSHKKFCYQGGKWNYWNGNTSKDTLIYTPLP